VHAANAEHPLEVYRYFRDKLGATHLQFIPIVERVPREKLPLAEQGWRADATPGRRTLLYKQEGDAVTSRTVDPAAWGEFLVAVFDEWVALDVGTVFVQHVDTALGNSFGQYSLCVHSPECGDAIAVEHNGDVYSCDHYVEPDYLLGNIQEDGLRVLVDSDRQRSFGKSKRSSLPSQCQECSVRWACHGGCPKDRFSTTAEGEDGLNYLCAGYFRFFSHITPAIGEMGGLLRAGRPAAEIVRARSGEEGSGDPEPRG